MNEKQKKVLEALGEVVAKLSDAKLAELAAYGAGMAFMVDHQDTNEQTTAAH